MNTSPVTMFGPTSSAYKLRISRWRRQSGTGRKILSPLWHRRTFSTTSFRGRWPAKIDREGAENLLRFPTQGPNESFTRFVEHVLQLIVCAGRQARKNKTLRVLMRGMRDDIFLNTLFKTNRQPSAPSFLRQQTISAPSKRALPNIGDTQASLHPRCLAAKTLLVRRSCTKLSGKLLLITRRQATLFVAEAVRAEVHQALLPEVPITMVVPEEPTLSYAVMAQERRQAPRQVTAPIRRNTLVPHHTRRQKKKTCRVRARERTLTEKKKSTTFIERPTDARSITTSEKPTTSTVDALTDDLGSVGSTGTTHARGTVNVFTTLRSTSNKLHP